MYDGSTAKALVAAAAAVTPPLCCSGAAGLLVLLAPRARRRLAAVLGSLRSRRWAVAATSAAAMARRERGDRLNGAARTQLLCQFWDLRIKVSNGLQVRRQPGFTSCTILHLLPTLDKVRLLIRIFLQKCFNFWHFVLGMLDFHLCVFLVREKTLG